MPRRTFRTLVAGAIGAAALLGTAPAASAEELQWYGWDITGDGWWETYFTDVNGDGWFDVAKFDVNLDGIEDGAAFDTSHNGLFDLYSLDMNQNGYAEIVGGDTDDDGAIDLVAIDRNENGVGDHEEAMPYAGSDVMGAPNYDGVDNLLLTMAGINRRATFGSGDYDGDGYTDPDDRYPDDRRYA